MAQFSTKAKTKEDWWNQRISDKIAEKKAHISANPLVNSSFQSLDPCQCGNGAPELVVLDGLLYFACARTGTGNKNGCHRMTAGVRLGKGARWEAAAQWNERVKPQGEPIQTEAAPQTVIPDESEWLAEQSFFYMWARRTGVHKVTRRR
jgi:hypothetical protein